MNHVLTTNSTLLTIKTALNEEKPEIGRILVNCEDASSFVLDYEGKILSTIFPPPSSKNIIALDYSFTTGKIYVLLANGSICIYQVDSETALMESIYTVNQIKVRACKKNNRIEKTEH